MFNYKLKNLFNLITIIIFLISIITLTLYLINKDNNNHKFYEFYENYINNIYNDLYKLNHIYTTTNNTTDLSLIVNLSTPKYMTPYYSFIEAEINKNTILYYLYTVLFLYYINYIIMYTIMLVQKSNYLNNIKLLKKIHYFVSLYMLIIGLIYMTISINELQNKLDFDANKIIYNSTHIYMNETNIIKIEQIKDKNKEFVKNINNILSVYQFFSSSIIILLYSFIFFIYTKYMIKNYYHIYI